MQFKQTTLITVTFVHRFKKDCLSMSNNKFFPSNKLFMVLFLIFLGRKNILKYGTQKILCFKK